MHKSIYIAVVLLIAVAAILAWAFLSGSDKASSPSGGPGGRIAYETYEDQDRGITFQYPIELGTVYLEAYDWPPMAQVIDEPFNCTEGGDPTARAGGTELRMVDNHQYCRTPIVEGAAGSIYTQYAYKFTVGEDQAAILTFSTRVPQCGNYDEQERVQCEGEREAFDIDSTVDEITQTFQIQ